MMTSPEFWLIGGLVLLIGEVVIPGLFLFWVGLAGIGTGLILLATAATSAVAIACFLALTTASVLTGAALRRRSVARSPAPVVNVAGSGLIGRTAVVTAIQPGGLRVRVGDSDWSARSANAAAVPGTAMQVVGVEGTILIVS